MPASARLFSGISRGTERLVLLGAIGPSEWERMRAPHAGGRLSVPGQIWLRATGVVEAGPANLVGRQVFALHPHQDYFNVPLDALVPIPEALPARRATLAANMETALNAVWDSGAGPGDRIVMVGAGVVGLLLAALAARLPGAIVTAVDVEGRAGLWPKRWASALPGPSSAPTDADVVFHASATGAGLDAAIRCAGLEAPIVELSWYGDRPAAVELGGAFHSRRLTDPVLPGRTDFAQPAPALELSAPLRGGAGASGPARPRRAGGRRDRLRNGGAHPAEGARRRSSGARPRHLLSPDLSRRHAMYAVEVRDRIMIAHSLPDPFFGPAQGLHGATFVVDVAFYREKLTPQNVVVDIGAALEVLKQTLKPLAYQNLDALPQFKGRLTTTEFLCQYVFEAMVEAAKNGALGEDGKDLARIKVTLHETDLARASFEGTL